MNKKIYEQHSNHFQDVTACAVLFKGNHVANIVWKFPRDGAGRLYCYVHWHGVEMVRGWASGGGYDKKTAAASAAAANLPPVLPDGTYKDGTPHYSPRTKKLFEKFRAAVLLDDGYDTDRHLRNAGFVPVCPV